MERKPVQVDRAIGANWLARMAEKCLIDLIRKLIQWPAVCCTTLTIICGGVEAGPAVACNLELRLHQRSSDTLAGERHEHACCACNAICNKDMLGRGYGNGERGTGQQRCAQKGK